MQVGDIKLRPVDSHVVLKERVYEALKSAITSMDFLSGDADTKLDERRLAAQLGVSRTPVREALARLEQEGLVRVIPRRGAFLVRKTKRETLEGIRVWGALEGLAARLAASHASDEEIAALRDEFLNRDGPRRPPASIDEYCDENIRFHQSIIRLGKSELLSKIAAGMLMHLYAIRARTLENRNRLPDLVVDQRQIIEALERRNGDLAARLIGDHTEHLARHIEMHVGWVEEDAGRHSDERRGYQGRH